MVTVTGLVFSLTIVSLQLASSQFGPRLLRTFMSSLGNQIVLGTFTSTFIYCLVVIGTVRDQGFVPQFRPATGILLGIIDIAVLIYFIHHVATSIRIENLIATVNADLREVIDATFPSEIGESPAERTQYRRGPPLPRRELYACLRHGSRLYPAHRQRHADVGDTRARSGGARSTKPRRFCRRGRSAVLHLARRER